MISLFYQVEVSKKILDSFNAQFLIFKGLSQCFENFYDHLKMLHTYVLICVT